MKTLKFAGAAAAVAVAVAAGLAAGVPAGTTARDAGGAPDITALAITDNPTTGAITIALTASPWPGDGDVVVLFDTDRNAATGYEGIDLALTYGQTPSERGWDIGQWDGKTFSFPSWGATVVFSRSGDVFTWTFSKRNAGIATGFSFVVVSAAYDADGNDVAADIAPDGGMWSYDLTVAPPVTTSPTVPKTGPAATVVPVLGKPLALPARPAAGKAFRFTVPVTRSDDGAPLKSGTLVASPAIGGKLVPHVEQLRNGVVTVSLLVPKSAKGKTLTIAVKVTSGGRAAAKTTTMRVA
jgi:hypothetical protein